MQADQRPLVLHVMYRFDVGGLENGVVNLINGMPEQSYRHAVLALDEVTQFRDRIKRDDVECIALHKAPGHGIWLYPALYKLFRRLRPQIVHSRNLAALEVQIPAWVAGVPVRIHGEHGRDVADLDGRNVKYQRIRRLYKPFVHHYTALSGDLAEYLVDRVHVPKDNITRICNGVDLVRFSPTSGAKISIAGCPFDPAQHVLVGTVGRMQPVKDPLTLAHAFAQALVLAPGLRSRLRLVMVGEGPLRAQAQAFLKGAGLSDLAWLPGERADVADIMRGLHIFALPSLAEGVSNTILEAMASALPVVATAVGANADLVLQRQTGYIVPVAHSHAMALRLVELATTPERALGLGQAGRSRAMALFGIQAMVSNYQHLYDQLLSQTVSTHACAQHQ